MVSLIVIVGGLTRLTNSGLSITEWELFAGILPPLNNSAWENYFNLYKEIPQYKLMNSNMTLDNFKIIFYWEYAHRILARLLGLFFILPFIYFYFTKKINSEYLKLCFLISTLILIQGLVGWYMVKSGLIENVTVSHYRLSLHLSIAFIIISMIFWNILNFKSKTFKNFFTYEKKSLVFSSLILLIFFQIIFGAFVSGLDAGQIYQTWPLMNQAYFPDDIDFNKFSHLLNFNDQSLIQFYHRNIAYLIIIYVIFLGIYIFKKKMNYLFNYYYIVL
ncbi:COX15/CtaA family protein, partial [Candidatus Pelagibacter bacterium]|nr:COX15/CtaA family protein [Candidatus Pelagibacter bacterium]